MKYLFIFLLALCSCHQKSSTTSFGSTSRMLDSSMAIAERDIEAAKKNSLRLDAILHSIKYIGIRDSFCFVAQKLEVLYYKTGQEKYRLKYSRIVDSIQKYHELASQQLKGK